jgi:hypothetical protein
MPKLPALELVYGTRRFPLTHRVVTVGRLPDCDVVLADDTVSRRHATIIPTPTGPLLVDQSRHGVMVNQEELSTPWVLADGDIIRIGESVLYVQREAWPRNLQLQGQTDGVGLGAKVGRWVRRYGPSEVVATLVAVGVVTAAKRATGSTIAAAYAGAVAETAVFYGIMFLRESIKEAHQAGKEGREYRTADLLTVFRNLVLEFGVAETLDVALIRPFFLGAGLRLLGGGIGVLAGKLAADLAFYGPVLTVYEWRLAKRYPSRPESPHRRTTATALTRPLDLEE